MHPLSETPPRKDAGVADRDGLENRCTLTGTEGSNPSLSAINTDNQAIKQTTPNFTPSFGREIGCFIWGLKGRKVGNKNFYSPFCSFKKEGIRLYTNFSLEPNI